MRCDHEIHSIELTSKHFQWLLRKNLLEIWYWWWIYAFLDNKIFSIRKWCCFCLSLLTQCFVFWRRTILALIDIMLSEHKRNYFTRLLLFPMWKQNTHTHTQINHCYWWNLSCFYMERVEKEKEGLVQVWKWNVRKD